MEAVPNQLAAALATRYLLERELGAGGMATVYLAQALRHDRTAQSVVAKLMSEKPARLVRTDLILAQGALR